MRRVPLDHKSRDKVLSAISAQRERSVKKIYELANRYAIDLSENNLELIASSHGKRDAEARAVLKSLPGIQAGRTIWISHFAT